MVGGARRARRPIRIPSCDAVLAGVARALRQRVASAVARGVRCVSTSLVGAPAIELTRHARRTGADMLVLGLGLGPACRGPFGRAWSADAAAQMTRTGAWHELGQLSTNPPEP